MPMRIALGLEYDGSAFCGWQTQPGGCGVQDHLAARALELRATPHRGHRRRAHGRRRARDARKSCTSIRGRERERSRGCAAPMPTCIAARACCGRSTCRRTSTRATAPARAPIAISSLNDARGARRCCAAAWAGTTARSTWARMARGRADRSWASTTSARFATPSARRSRRCATSREARGRRGGQPRRLHVPRQRVPAPHGAQHRGIARLRGRRDARAGMDRGARSPRATARVAAPTFAPDGLVPRGRRV